MLAQDRINVELIFKILSEQKTTLLSLRNRDWKKIKVETRKVNNELQHIPTENITELNELIYAGAILFSDKIVTLERIRIQIQNQEENEDRMSYKETMTTSETAKGCKTRKKPIG